MSTDSPDVDDVDERNPPEEGSAEGPAASRSLVELPDGPPSRETSAFWEDAAFDTGVPEPDAIRTGIAEVFPGVAPPLTWTVAAPALEYGLRISLCSGLGLLEWPSLGAEWALVGRVSGRAVLRRGVLEDAAQAIRRHPRRITVRASRLRRMAMDRGARVGSMTTALRAGRLHSDVATRTDDDLLLTVSRLRELAFSAWAHLSEASLSEVVGRVERGPESLAATVAVAGPVPLWGTSGERGESAQSTPALRSLADALRVSLTEIRILTDVLAQRLAEDDVLGDPADVAYATWDELPVLLGGSSARSASVDRLGLRRLQHHRLVADAQ